MKALLFIIALTISVGAFSQAYSKHYIDSLETLMTKDRGRMMNAEKYLLYHPEEDTIILYQKYVMIRMIMNSTTLRKYYILAGKTQAQSDIEDLQRRLRLFRKQLIFKPLEL